MKVIHRILMLGCLVLMSVSAQAQRAIPAADSVLACRSLNNLRVWTFTVKAKDIGRLVSFMDGVESINGRSAVRINREFNINYGLLNQALKLEAVGQGFVSSRGHYLGDNLMVTTDSLSEQLELEVDDTELSGFFTRQGRHIDQTLAWPVDQFAWDPNFIDQLELYLAMHPMAVGSEFADSVFQPQSLLYAPISGYCDDFRYVELYRGKFDSVFTIHLTNPTAMDLYFTADRELVRADFLTRGIRVYLDANSLAQPNAPSRPPVTESRISINRMPQYFVFLVVGFLGMLFFSRSFYRYLESYFALLAGIAAFLLTLVTQVPLQEMLLGIVDSSTSLTLTTFMLPAAMAAVIQEVLKLMALALVLRFLRPQPGRAVVVGALVGGIFGVVEACWMIGFGSATLDFWTLMQNGAMILYHVSAGVLIGSSISGGAKRWLGMLGVVTVIHAGLRFLPALAFTGQLDDPLVAMIVAAIVLVLVGLTLQVNSRRNRKQP